MYLVVLLFVLLASFDAWFTAKRIPQLGIEAEYNPLIRWLSYRFGIKTGIYVGILGPTLILVGISFVWPCVLIYLLGCRTTLFAFQMKVINAD